MKKRKMTLSHFEKRVLWDSRHLWLLLAEATEMNPGERKVFFLRIEKEFTYKEIGRRLGISAARVSELLARAQKKIERKWKKELKEVYTALATLQEKAVKERDKNILRKV